MHVSRLLIAVALIGSTLAIDTPMAKADLTLGATNRGWIWDFDFGANGSAPGKSYLVGATSVGGVEGIHFRNWFVFDLTAVLTPIASAELLLDNPGIFSDDGSEIYQLTATTSTPATLIAAGGGAGVFASLGTGTVFSTITVFDPADDGVTLSLALNAAGIAFLNANLGELVAFSGRLTTLDDSPDELVFGGTDAASSTELHMELTPGAPPEIVIDGCDTGVENQLLEEGMMGDLISQCAEGVVNHGEFVQCVAHLTNLWKGEGLIVEQEKEQIQSCAGEAEIP